MTRSRIMVAGEITTMSERGRPPLGDQKLVRCTVYLSADEMLTAHRIGGGNVSEGVRRQLADLASVRTWHEAQRDQRATPPAVQPRRRHQ